MGFNLGHWLEETWADVNPFDNGRTGATVRKQRQRAAPARTISNQNRQRPSFQVNQRGSLTPNNPGLSIKPLTLDTPKLPTLKPDEVKPQIQAPKVIAEPDINDRVKQFNTFDVDRQRKRIEDLQRRSERQDTSAGAVADRLNASKVLSSIQQRGKQRQGHLGTFGADLWNEGIVNPARRAVTKVTDTAQQQSRTKDLNHLLNTKQINQEQYNSGLSNIYKNSIDSKLVNNRGKLQIQAKNPFEFTKGFSQTGADLGATYAPVGTGVSLAKTGFRAAVPQIAKETAAWTAAATGADVLNDRPVTPQSIAMNAGGAALGVGGGLIGARGAKNAVRAHREATLKAATDTQQPIRAKTSVLNSYEGAPDRLQVEKYKQAIRQGRPVDPIITMKDQTGRYGIEDGKHRFQAYKELGFNEVPVKVATPERVQAVAQGGYAKMPGKDPLESLKQEARKYKSADEFVNNHTPLYRGGKGSYDASKVTDRGVSTATSKENAQWFAGGYGPDATSSGKTIEKLLLSPDAKVLDINSMPKDVLEGFKKLNTDNTTLNEELALVNYARKNGYDAINLKPWNENEVRVINPEKLKTKQQLTDLYNQATQSQPPNSTLTPELKSLQPQEYEVPTQIKGASQQKKNPSKPSIPEQIKSKTVDSYAKVLRDTESGQTGGQMIPDAQGGYAKLPEKPNLNEGAFSLEDIANLEKQIKKQEATKSMEMPFANPYNTPSKLNTRPVPANRVLGDTKASEALAATDLPSVGRQSIKTLQSEPERNATRSFEEATKKYLGATKSSDIDRQVRIRELEGKFDLSDSEKINAIQSIDDSTIKPMNKKVAEFNKEFKRLTDEAYEDYTVNKGIKMGYVNEYIPRIYKNPLTGQEISGPEYKILTQGSARQRGREAADLNVDALIYKNPSELLNKYYQSLDRAVAGRQYLDELSNNGVLVKSTSPVRGMKPIVAEGLQSADGMTYYAPPNVATKLNRVFGTQEPTNIVEAGVEKGAQLNSLMQSVVLSGGVPNTPLNAFGVMQVMKEAMALHPVKAARAMFSGINKKYADKVFTEKKDILKLMAENDIEVRVDLSKTGKTGLKRVQEAFGEKGKASGIDTAWNEFTNDATFGRFMPMLETLHFENVYKSALKRNNPQEAARIAAESTKNFYGKSSNFSTTTRSKLANDSAGAILFAPRFRESMLNFWLKNAKAVNPKTWGSKEYRDNHKFLIASGATLWAMDALNEALNGTHLSENPDGKNDKLIIPSDKVKKLGIDTGGKDVAIPFLPSISTVPRNAGMGLYNFLTGKDDEGWKNVKAFASMPISTGLDIATDQDYFGNKITSDDASPVDKRIQQATYAVSRNMQPWVREGLNIAGKNLPEEMKKKLGIKEKGVFETIANAGELPFRFYKPEHYRYGDNWTPRGKEGEKFSFKEQRERAGIKGEINKIASDLGLNERQKNEFEALSSVEFNDDGTLKEDNNPFYKVQRYSKLQDDGVFEAMKRKAELNAKLNGKPIDPIFTLDGEARRVVLWKKTLPPGTSDPTVKQLYEQDWYQDYRQQEDKYYNDKTAWNKQMGYKNTSEEDNPYPKISAEVEKAQDYYFNLPKGTGARSGFIRNNPDVWNKLTAFWEAKDAWTNNERGKLGLGDIEDKKSGNSYGGRRKYASRGRRGGGGRKSGSKLAYKLNGFGQTNNNKQLRALLKKAKIKAGKTKTKSPKPKIRSKIS